MKALESVLGSLAPSRTALNRDRIMFEAGRASARTSRSSHRAWPAVSTLLALISITEAALLIHRHPPAANAPQLAERRPIPTSQSPDTAPSPVVVPDPLLPYSQEPDWLLSSQQTPRDLLTDQVLRYGLDGLPSPAPPTRNDTKSFTWQSHQPLPDELVKELELGGPS